MDEGWLIVFRLSHRRDYVPSTVHKDGFRDRESRLDRGCWCRSFETRNVSSISQTVKEERQARIGFSTHWHHPVTEDNLFSSARAKLCGDVNEHTKSESCPSEIQHGTKGCLWIQSRGEWIGSRWTLLVVVVHGSSAEFALTRLWWLGGFPRILDSVDQGKYLSAAYCRLSFNMCL